jgi:hypothetical protein
VNWDIWRMISRLNAMFSGWAVSARQSWRRGDWWNEARSKQRMKRPALATAGLRKQRKLERQRVRYARMHNRKGQHL